MGRCAETSLQCVATKRTLGIRIQQAEELKQEGVSFWSYLQLSKQVYLCSCCSDCCTLAGFQEPTGMLESTSPSQPLPHTHQERRKCQRTQQLLAHSTFLVIFGLHCARPTIWETAQDPTCALFSRASIPVLRICGAASVGSCFGYKNL